MHVSVRATQPVRYRAAMRFTDLPRVLDVAEIGEAALASLRADPVLVVEEAPAPDAGPGPALDDPRRAAVLDAIRDLDETSDFNKDGTPKIAAVREASGHPDLTADELRAYLA